MEEKQVSNGIGVKRNRGRPKGEQKQKTSISVSNKRNFDKAWLTLRGLKQLNTFSETIEWAVSYALKGTLKDLRIEDRFKDLLEQLQ